MWLLNQIQLRITTKPPSQPDKRLLILVIALSRDVEVLEFVAPVVGNHFSLDFSVLDIDFVPTEDDWNVVTDSTKVPMPFRNVFIGNSRADIEHDDGALPTDIVPVTKTP